ncbi:MAG: DNA mismatch repair protein MutS [Cytophagales bacterium]
MKDLFGEDHTITIKKRTETPLMKQHAEIKEKHPGALVLFRVGDFFETFGEDAIKASGILGITLTKRGNGSASETELAGFPHHSLDTYLPKLVKAGQRVAICEQLENPKFAKGLVKRGLTELVTPGVVMNDNVLSSKLNNYLASVYYGENLVGISFLDISTGDFWVTEGSQTYIDKLLQSFLPAEVIISKRDKQSFLAKYEDKFNCYPLDEWVYRFDYGYESLLKHFNTLNLKGFGIDEFHAGIVAAGAILYYLKLTEHNEISHISHISRIEEEKYVWLDRFTIRNLELINSPYEGGVPLVQIIDKTISPMGGRLLRRWLLMPLKDVASIQSRHQVVDFFYSNRETRQSVRECLNEVGDLERLVSKVAAKRINPRELGQLKRSLEKIGEIIQILKDLKLPTELKKMVSLLNICDFLVAKIRKELKPEVGIFSNQGNIICDGVHTELDELRKIAYSGKDYLLQITYQEIERTGISSLKIQFNKVFGYYLEVTNSHKNKVPNDWIRKQTTVNGERYVTEELKLYEEKILGAEDKINALEQILFNELMACAASYVPIIQQDAKLIAELDCLSSFAQVAEASQYVKPKLNETNALHIKAGRHPVIEKQLGVGENYVPNDVFLDNENQQIIIITGPNMAGKSALLRQTALIVLMAQIGSYVPADEAVIGVIDKIFTRVGASDNLSKGESTFMVEMTETASILNNLSDKSLVLMDEIGRGTSTYDGISIAWSIVEFLHNHPKFKAKTLFATHYHELNEIATDLPRVKNFNVSVKEAGNKIIFMRKLKEGGAEHSFGIHVAQMAGIPNHVVLRADEIMHKLEESKMKEQNLGKMKTLPKASQNAQKEVPDVEYARIKEVLDKIDVNIMSPIEALLKLNEVKNLMK